VGIRAVVGLNLRTGDALLSVKTAVFSATQDLFDEEIVPTAKELSPVTAEGYQRNVAEKKKHPSGTGTNRRSIDSTIVETEKGPEAKLYTTSGYGGYLELGTAKMRAQPYLNPAFEMHIGKLSEKVKEKLGG
jgi:HK97 gp10 family phage protein